MRFDAGHKLRGSLPRPIPERPFRPPLARGFAGLATFRSDAVRSSTAVLPNGLPLYRISVEGARSTTILVAFDAGARTEREDENGMAHFLEHLVFKGGEKYPTYRDVNEAAERIGAVLNAYTSHDLVAFHITARAEQGPGGRRPAHRLRGAPENRRRRAQPRARRGRPGDRPGQRSAGGDGRAPDRRGRVRRSSPGPPRPRAGRAHPRHVHARRASSPSASVAGLPSRGGAFLVGNLEGLPEQRRRRGAVHPLSGAPGAGPVRARAAGASADPGQRARLQPVAPADVLPARRSRSRTPRSGRR